MYNQIIIKISFSQYKNDEPAVRGISQDLNDNHYAFEYIEYRLKKISHAD